MNYFNEIEKYKHNVALVTAKENFTYKSLIDFSNKITAKIKERCLVMIKCQNSFEVFVAYVAFVRLNSVIILIDSNISESRYKKIIEAYKPDYIFQTKNNTKLNIGYNHFNSLGLFELLENKNKINVQLKDDLSLLIPTSGSMGSVKFVRQSYKNTKCNIDQVSDSLNIGDQDRAITTMPLNYTYGLSIVNSHLHNGSSIILNNHSLVDRNFWKLLENKEATNFGGVPFIYEILNKIDFKKKITKNLKYVTQAGGKLSIKLSEKFVHTCKEKNLKFIIMYGQTEASSRMSFLPWKFAEMKIGSIGKPVKNGKFSLVDKNGDIININNKMGELVYEGENVTLGYATNYLDLNKGDENRGKLFTGDLAKRDNDNFYYITGRLKRISKIFGTRINLDEVEMLIKNWGQDCVCTGDDKLIKFYFISDFNNDEMLKKISQNIGIHKSGIRLNKIKKIPRNHSGKILYSELN